MYFPSCLETKISASKAHSLSSFSANKHSVFFYSRVAKTWCILATTTNSRFSLPVVMGTSRLLENSSSTWSSVKLIDCCFNWKLQLLTSWQLSVLFTTESIKETDWTEQRAQQRLRTRKELRTSAENLRISSFCHLIFPKAFTVFNLCLQLQRNSLKINVIWNAKPWRFSACTRFVVFFLCPKTSGVVN